MEGYLFKWTNYVSRWQKRWFILDAEKGTLSYFENSEESTIIAGNRGSWRVCDCDLIVSDADAEGFQLLSAGGAQRVYLRAVSTSERALWLKALAHTKMVRNQAELNAATPVTTTSQNEEVIDRSPSALPSHHAVHTLTISSPVVPSSVSPSSGSKSAPLSGASCHKTRSRHADDASAYVRRLCSAGASVALRANGSTLRTRCDALVSQIEAARRVATDQTVCAYEFSFTPETRERFLAACESCRAALRVCLDDAQLSDTSIVLRNDDRERFAPNGDMDWPRRARNKSESSIVSRGAARGRKRVCDTLFATLESSFSSILVRKHASDCDAEERERVRREVDSASLNGVAPHGDDVDVDALISACREVTLIFDYLNAAAFAPVKMDMIGNVRKLQAGKAALLASSSRAAGSAAVTLRELFSYEMTQRQNEQDESATVATLWLLRALEFVIEFLRELLINTSARAPSNGDDDCNALVEGQQDAADDIGGAGLCEIAEHVYQRTLARYHDWVVRGMFKLAVRTLPDKATFVRQLLVGLPRSRRTVTGQSQSSSSPQRVSVSARQVEQLLFDMDDYVASLDAAIGELRAAYIDCGLSHLVNESQPVTITS